MASDELDAVAEGATAYTIGAAAPLSCAGLTVEPTSTPNASSAITATPTTDGEGATSRRESAARESATSDASEAIGSSGAGLARASPSRGTAPISSATASGSGPRRRPHSTQ